MLDAMDVAEREGLEGDEMLERAFLLKTTKGWRQQRKPCTASRIWPT